MVMEIDIVITDARSYDLTLASTSLILGRAFRCPISRDAPAAAHALDTALKSRRFASK
jgi:hypothetical protein